MIARSKLAACGFAMFLVGIVLFETLIEPRVEAGKLSVDELVWLTIGTVVYLLVMVVLLACGKRSVGHSSCQ